MRSDLRTPRGRYAVELEHPDGRRELLYNPQPRQDALHACSAPNVLYGGAAGGGKSHALRWHGIIAAARTPQFRALLLRRAFTDLEKSHLLDLPIEVPTALARYDQSRHRLVFPNGSIVQFGHCQTEKDVAQYLSSQWDLIAVDEASTFTPRQLRLLKSRVRTTKPHIRPQFVCSSNPGGDAHLYLLQRFIEHNPPESEQVAYDPADWVFIPSTLDDNAYLDTEAYDKTLRDLSEQEYAAYRRGDWYSFAGQYFREWRRDVHVTAQLPPADARAHLVVECGMDYGYDPHPSVVEWGAFDEHGRPLLVAETRATLMTADELGDAIADAAYALARHGFTGALRATIHGDTQMWTPQAERGGVTIAEMINTTLAERGTGITLVKAQKERINGWQRVHSFLNPRRRHPDGQIGPWLTVYDPGDADAPGLGCPYLIATIGAQVHDDRGTGDLKKGPTDHACDALRYLARAREPVAAPLVTETPTHRQRVSRHARQLLERALARHRADVGEGTDALTDGAEAQVDGGPLTDPDRLDTPDWVSDVYG